MYVFESLIVPQVVSIVKYTEQQDILCVSFEVSLSSAEFSLTGVDWLKCMFLIANEWFAFSFSVDNCEETVNSQQLAWFKKVDI